MAKPNNLSRFNNLAVDQGSRMNRNIAKYLYAKSDKSDPDKSFRGAYQDAKDDGRDLGLKGRTLRQYVRGISSGAAESRANDTSYAFNATNDPYFFMNAEERKAAEDNKAWLDQVNARRASQKSNADLNEKVDNDLVDIEEGSPKAAESPEAQEQPTSTEETPNYVFGNYTQDDLDKMSFSDAFAAARKAGQKTFYWRVGRNGKPGYYGTNLKSKAETNAQTAQPSTQATQNDSTSTATTTSKTSATTTDNLIGPFYRLYSHYLSLDPTNYSVYRVYSNKQGGSLLPKFQTLLKK